MSPATGAAPRAGFTLLEVMVALLLLTGAFLAVAQLLAVAGRAADQSRATALGTALVAQKIEQLRALSWAYDIDGTPIDGLSLSPPGALTVDAAGFVDYFDDAGGWSAADRLPRLGPCLRGGGRSSAPPGWHRPRC